MERLSFNPRRPHEHARRVAAALEKGPAFVPALGGIVALGRGPGALTAAFGAAFRVVTDEKSGCDDRVAQALAGPAVARLDVGDGWAGLAAAREPLLAAVAALVPDLGIGVPDDPEEIEEQVEAGSVTLVVDTPGEPGPGPTVVDLRSRPATVDRKGALAILELEARLGERVRLGPGLAFSVLVVCTGNSCRSPMAHGILARMLEGERAFIYSAGTDAPVGAPATRAAVEAAAELGADISGHRAQQLTAAHVAGADLVLVMEDYHRQRVLELARDAGSRVRLLGGYLPGADPGREIADPVGRPLEVYRRAAAEIHAALERVAEETRNRLEDSPRPGRAGSPPAGP